MKNKFLIVLFLVTPFLTKAQWTDPGNDSTGAIYYNNGNIGIGTTTPAQKLDISGAYDLWNLRFHNADGDYDWYLGASGDNWSIGGNKFTISTTGASTNSKFTIDNSGFIGIGTFNPLSKLHIREGNTGGSPHSFSKLTVEHSDNAMISILTPNDKVAYYGFADADDQFVSGMMYSHLSNDLTFRVNNHSYDVVIRNDGNVGIGTTSPTEKLHVAGGLKLRHSLFSTVSGSLDNSWIRDSWLTSNIGIRWDEETNLWVRENYIHNDFGGIVWQDEGTYFIRVGNGTKLEYTNQEFLNSAFLFADIHNGNVGIGTTNPSEKLTVDGKILAEEVKVQNVPQSDYVFEPDYPLLPLGEVESYIKENKHLPDIPSAEEFKQNGVGLGEMDDMLLRKIEELTLYVIELKKENEELKEENSVQNLLIQSLIEKHEN